MATKIAADLEVGDWFIDPIREGRRPAQVLDITGVFEGRVHLTLDDNTRWGKWAAAYQADEVLELA